MTINEARQKLAALAAKQAAEIETIRGFQLLVLAQRETAVLSGIELALREISEPDEEES